MLNFMQADIFFGTEKTGPEINTACNNNIR